MTKYLQLIDLSTINTISITVRLGLAVLFGGLIGLERGRKNRPAGFRTYILVCVGSALTMITNQYVVETFTDLNIDPVRMGAQVISGVGFLGAGTIMNKGGGSGRIGLTSAAALWASACMGLAIGIGFYNGAIIACFYILLSVTVFHSFSERLSEKSKVFDIYVELESLSHVSQLIEFARSNDLSVVNIEIEKGEMSNEIIAFMTIRCIEKRSHAEVVSCLSTLECIRYITEMN